MGTGQPTEPRVFVSHSHADNDYAREFVAALRKGLNDADDSRKLVWYDEHNLGWGVLHQEIDKQLTQRQHFIAIVSPDAVTSAWVDREIYAALYLLDVKKTMQTFQLVTAAKCEVAPTLQGYIRIEAPLGQAYPP
ncbi:MAG: toll/interleukin-1 receptor domain-containing protein, partial [Ktedonobacterales bacterium]